MRNLFRSVTSWFESKKTATSVEAVIFAHEPVLEPVHEPVREPVTQPAFEVVHTPSHQPVAQAPLAALKVLRKGAHFYAICPHCESQWNLQSRIMDPRVKRLVGENKLTCPKCDEPVATPALSELKALA